MSYSLMPYKTKEGVASTCVFFLCKDEKTPFEIYRETCKDDGSVAKMAKAIESISKVGIANSRAASRIKCLNKGEGGDLYEIKTNRCTARAYSFLLGEDEVLIVAFIEGVTHAGKGKKNTQRAIRKLNNMRASLNDALERENEHGSEL